MLHATLRLLIFATLLATALPAAAQQERLGMKVFGDDDTAFGLLISNWQNEDNPPLFAPGLLAEDLEPTDPWRLEMQFRARQAVGPPPERP